MSLADRFEEAPLTQRLERREIAIPEAGLREGLNLLDEVMVFRRGDEAIAYDRLCDHAGGRLISKDRATAMCPLHGWRFDPATGRYLNVAATKRPLALRRTAGGWTAEIEQRTPELPVTDEATPVTVRFLNHACLVVEAPGVRFATDPWLFGPAFCNGWWLAQPSPADALDAVNACDFVFISHNHPDHLHPETLAGVRKDMPMLTAGFASRSTELYLRDLGFADVLAARFGSAYRRRDGALTLTVLKSGDFRDDSGLYFSIGGFSAVLTVDANFLNFGALPPGIGLLATSFAGGASGFPLCFDTYDMDEKRRILTRNRAAIMAGVEAYLKACRPAAYMPYAGFFTEDPVRDPDIRAHNAKNRPQDYADVAQRHGARLVDVTQTPVARFAGRRLEQAEPQPHAAAMPERPRAAYHAEAEARFGAIADAEIAAYFAASGFRGELILNIGLSDVDFRPERWLSVDFRGAAPVTRAIEAAPDPEALHRQTGAQVANARIRTPAFVRTLRDGLPWEDLSIGFQARFDRHPNIYESDFWFHFTNVHIAARARRAVADCGQACRRIEATLY